MIKYKITNLKYRPELKYQAAEWFHEKWGISSDAYLESMDACFKNQCPVPQWYIVLEGDNIVAGLGVIENDFHNRKELTPNICALYVEESYRKQGIAGIMLNFVIDEFKIMGIDTLYLVTEHTTFYERYGWEFLCMVQEDGDLAMTRMYIHK